MGDRRACQFGESVDHGGSLKPKMVEGGDVGCHGRTGSLAVNPFEGILRSAGARRLLAGEIEMVIEEMNRSQRMLMRQRS